MVRNPYRRSFYRQLIRWVLILSAAVLIGAGVGVLIGRFYFPNVEPWELAILAGYEREAELRDQAEGDYYRGVLSSCVAFGMGSGMSRDMVAATCGSYWVAAYKADWYHELTLDSWQWPPDVSGGN